VLAIITHNLAGRADHDDIFESSLSAPLYVFSRLDYSDVPAQRCPVNRLSRRVSYKGIASNKVGHNSVTHVTTAPIVGPGGRGTTNYPTFLRTVQPISPEPVVKLVREVRTSVNQTCILVH
jgi:hypothetical protein